jgi:hypothetical protein
MTVLPRDKFDISAVQQLSQAEPSEIEKLAPQLLEWLQDANWPIAVPMANMLVTYQNNILSEVSVVLRGEDPIWKYWCIELLVKKLNSKCIMALKSDLENLANNPSSIEVLEEVSRVAKEVLSTNAA